MEEETKPDFDNELITKQYTDLNPSHIIDSSFMPWIRDLNEIEAGRSSYHQMDQIDL